jgi:ribosomal RNA-processing protein 36
LEQSSKRAVSRRRDIVAGDIPKRQTARDPRFDRWTAGARPVDEAKVRRAYSFLDDYRAKELADMRAELKKTKAADRKEELKRRIMSMESQRKAAQRKDEEAKLLADHRRAEKELVAQGKQPYYLKRGEQKKQLLMKRFASMSKSQVDKAIERKRKKVAGKEKQELDSWTRVRDRH